MNLKMYFYDACKWDEDCSASNVATFQNVKSFKFIRGGDQAKKYRKRAEGGPDELNEYLILTFDSGERRIFRNSHVWMFKEK